MKKNKYGLCLIGGILLLMLLPALSLGAETSAESAVETAPATSLELSLDEAIQRALAVSKDLNLADYSIERNEELQEAAVKEVKYTPLDNKGSDEADQATLNLVQSVIALQGAKKSKETKKDTLISSVREKYTNVLLNQEKVTAAEKALEVADFERWSARVKYQLGKLDANSKVEAEKNFIIKESALQESRTNLADSYVKLNHIIGLQPQDRPLLSYEPEFVPLNILDLDAEVQRRLEIDPNLWQAQKDIIKAKLELSLYNYSGSTETYRIKEIDLDNTKLEAANSEDLAGQKVYALYTSIRLLEEQYKTKEQNRQLAEQKLQANQVKFNLGMIAKGEVLAAELEAENARLSLKTTLYEHEQLKRSFDKPWIA